MVRDYTKYDDSPVSLTQFAESAVRAYKVAMTPPMEPVVIVADAVLQEEPMSEADRRTARIPKLTLPSPPAGDSGAVAEAAKMLVAAENPVIVAGRVGTHSERHQTAGGTGGTAAGSGAGSPVPHEFPDETSFVRRRQHRGCGRDPRPGSAGFLDGDAYA